MSSLVFYLGARKKKQNIQSLSVLGEGNEGGRERERWVELLCLQVGFFQSELKIELRKRERGKTTMKMKTLRVARRDH